MFFQMASRRDPLAEIREFQSRIDVARGQPLTPAEIRDAVESLLGADPRPRVRRLQTASVYNGGNALQGHPGPASMVDDYAQRPRLPDDGLRHELRSAAEAHTVSMVPSAVPHHAQEARQASAAGVHPEGMIVSPLRPFPAAYPTSSRQNRSPTPLPEVPEILRFRDNLLQSGLVGGDRRYRRPIQWESRDASPAIGRPVSPNASPEASEAPRQQLLYGEPTGWLAEIRETGGRGMRTISSGVDDPGGVSVGRFQITQSNISEFLASTLGAPWRRELEGLRPGSPEFRRAWNRIIDREPADFERAQYEFLYQENYSRPAAAARRIARFDLSAANPVVQEALWSMSNNVGPSGATQILVSAIGRADRQYRRDDPRHQEALIRELYTGWIAHLRRREGQNQRRRPGTARQYHNMAERTVPGEMNAALRAYRE